MRSVAEVPHELFQITIFQWNGKYILKIGLDQFEQTFKFNEMEQNLQEIIEMLNADFLDRVFKRFISMREDRSQAINALKSI